jgi:phage terminase small subunit
MLQKPPKSYRKLYRKGSIVKGFSQDLFHERTAMNTAIAESGLTDKQERFAHEYLLDQNASAACLRAGYAAHSHAVQGAQLMAHPGVRKRIRGLLEELYSRIKIDAVRLMQARVDTAFFDPRTLVDAGNRPRPLGEWTDQTADVMLVSFDVRASGETVMKVRQPSRAAALTALERRFAQFMQMRQEDTITRREADHLQLSLGHAAGELKPGEVLRFTNSARRWEAAAPAVPAAGQAPAPGVESGAKPEVETGAAVMSAANPAATLVAAPGAAPSPAAAPVPAAGPAPTLVQRALGALKGLGRGNQAPGQAAPTARPQAAPPPVSAKARAQEKYWCDLEGNINLDHPNLPPEVRARELEKRRLRQLQEEERNGRGRELRYVHSNTGLPRLSDPPPWPRDPQPGRERVALNNAEDPFD